MGAMVKSHLASGVGKVIWGLVAATSAGNCHVCSAAGCRCRGHLGDGSYAGTRTRVGCEAASEAVAGTLCIVQRSQVLA
jgi:hypothetical protein